MLGTRVREPNLMLYSSPIVYFLWDGIHCATGVAISMHCTIVHACALHIVWFFGLRTCAVTGQNMFWQINI